MASSVWNTSLATAPAGHLMFSVISAKGISSEKPLEFFVRITGKNFKDKTRMAKKDMTPTWSDVFYLEQAPTKLDFTVNSPDGLSDKFWGETSCDGLDSILPEVVVEKWLDLNLGTNKTKRTIGGQILVRFIRTSLPTTRSLIAKEATELHFEHRRIKKFRTGDLILFSGAGPHNTAARLLNGSNYSSAGILLQLPNKWTKQNEWYVLEASENCDKLLDPVSGTLGPGLRLFEFADRMYNFHGCGVWWVPQSKELDEEQIDILRRSLLQVYHGMKDIPFPPPNPRNVEAVGWKPMEVTPEMIKLLGQFYERAKPDESIYYPLRSGELVGIALSSIGLVDAAATDTTTWTMAQILSSVHFNFSKSRLLRVSTDTHHFYTNNDTDKNSKLSFGSSFFPSTSFIPLAERFPSEKFFAGQQKQINNLHSVSKVQLTQEESNLLQAASKELLKKKPK